jgi:hypothetical protein
MNIQQVKEQIEEMTHYVNLYNDYKADTLEQKVFKYYAEIKNGANVTKMVNDEGYRYETGRKLTSNDISDILDNPQNEFEKIVSKIFQQSRKKVAKIWG